MDCGDSSRYFRAQDIRRGMHSGIPGKGRAILGRVDGGGPFPEWWGAVRQSGTPASWDAGVPLFCGGGGFYFWKWFFGRRTSAVGCTWTFRERAGAILGRVGGLGPFPEWAQNAGDLPAHPGMGPFKEWANESTSTQEEPALFGIVRFVSIISGTRVTDHPGIGQFSNSGLVDCRQERVYNGQRVGHSVEAIAVQKVGFNLGQFRADTPYLVNVRRNYGRAGRSANNYW